MLNVRMGDKHSIGRLTWSQWPLESACQLWRVFGHCNNGRAIMNVNNLIVGPSQRRPSAWNWAQNTAESIWQFIIGAPGRELVPVGALLYQRQLCVGPTKGRRQAAQSGRHSLWPRARIRLNQTIDCESNLALLTDIMQRLTNSWRPTGRARARVGRSHLVRRRRLARASNAKYSG